MRRVVVTGLGMVSPLGCGVEATGRTSSPARAAAVRDHRLPGRRSCLPDRLPDSARPEGRGQVQSRRVDGAEGEPQGRRFHRLRDGRGRPGARRRRLASRDATRTRSRPACSSAPASAASAASTKPRITLRDRGPAPHQPVLHSRPADQPRLRPGLDPPRPEGPEPCGRHRLLDRRARHRRRRAG